MKKQLLAAALGLGLTAGAFAGSNVGPGLGGIVVDAIGDGLLSQVTGVWLNGLFCNQTFAITFGTSGASGWDGLVMAPAEKFIQENMDFVATDIAVGNGEYIDTVATLLEVQDVEAFKAKAHENFDNIFTSADVTASEVAARLVALN